MKKKLQKALFTLSITLTFSLKIHSQTIKTVEINASALVDDKSTDNYSIVIYSDGVLKDSIYNKKTKSVNLALESNKLYSVVFKKANYSDKIVIVDTKIPSGLRELHEEPFELQIELSQSATVKPDLIDYPVAILTVSRKEKSLMASETYHKFTHQ
jgi:ribosomal protein L25 (general stress protein Ctc)